MSRVDLVLSPLVLLLTTITLPLLLPSGGRRYWVQPQHAVLVYRVLSRQNDVRLSPFPLHSTRGASSRSPSLTSASSFVLRLSATCHTGGATTPTLSRDASLLLPRLQLDLSSQTTVFRSAFLSSLLVLVPPRCIGLSNRRLLSSRSPSCTCSRPWFFILSL